MRVKLAKPYARNWRPDILRGLIKDKVYSCEFAEKEDGDRVMLEGQDTWLPFEYFEVVKAKPVRRSGETADEIAVWFGDNVPDAIAGMSQEIHMLRNALHDCKSELTGKLGCALAIVDLSAKHQKQIDALMVAFNSTK